MNNETVTTEFQDMLARAADKLSSYSSEIEWFSWPETFGDTSGPRGGIGGQAFTTFQVYAFRNNAQEEGVKCCAGVWKYWSGRFMEFWK